MNHSNPEARYHEVEVHDVGVPGHDGLEKLHIAHHDHLLTPELGAEHWTMLGIPDDG